MHARLGRKVAGGLEIDDMLEVLEEKKTDYDYLRNKTEELKAAMDLSTQMIDNVANEPVVTMWFEFKE